MKIFIDTKEEHNQVLYELGLLDDDDHWELFTQMREEEIVPDEELWQMYVIIPRNG
jgi:hypothetical protein